MADEQDIGMGGNRQDHQQRHQEMKDSGRTIQGRNKLLPVDKLKILRWVLFIPASFVAQRIFIPILGFPIVAVLPNRLGLVITYAIAGVLSTLVAALVAPNRRVLATFITCGVNLVFSLPIIINTFSSFGIDQLLDSGAEYFSSSVQMIALIAGSLLAAILTWFRSR